MIFFTNDSQFKDACSAVDNQFKLDSIATYIESTEIELERLLGPKTLAVILTDIYDLLSVMRRCVADLSLAAYTSSGAVVISNSGIHVVTGGNHAPASDKKLMAFKRDAIERGWSTFEQLIILLERFSVKEWKESNERERYFSALFSNSTEFGPFGGVAISASVYMRFRNTIVNVQDDILVPALGRDLLDMVVGFNTVQPTDSKDKQLQRLCMRVVAPQVVADALRYNAIELNDNGVYQSAVTSGSDNVEAKASASAQMLMRTINRLTVESESCLVKLNKFLKENADRYSTSTASVYPVVDMNSNRDSNVYVM